MYGGEKRQSVAGLGLSYIKQRSSFPAVTTPSVNGDNHEEEDEAEHGLGGGQSINSTSTVVMSERPRSSTSGNAFGFSADASMGGSTSSNVYGNNGMTPIHTGAIREHQYSRNDEDDDADGLYADSSAELSVAASGSNSRPGTSRSYSSNNGYYGNNDNTPVVRSNGSGLSTPLLGASTNSNNNHNNNQFSHSVDSTFPPSPRSPSFYRDKDDLSFEDPALRYGGLHVGDRDRDKDREKKNGSATHLLLNGLGVNKHANRSTSSIINVASSPALGGGGGSAASSPIVATFSGISSPSSSSSGWRAILSGRKKIHPFALGPAFLLGIIVAISGVFGPNDSSSSAASWASTISSTLTSQSLSSAISNLARPAYVSHSSGHIFMDQARTTLGQIEHPIHGLIRNATVRWEQLQEKQSKTLAEAVSEYKRRYNRNPPKGFDDWFRYAQEKNVVLVDEYDQIYRDILPFWSLSQNLLRTRITELENNEFTHTFVVKNGKIEIVGAKKELSRARDQADLMKDFVKYLPEVNITMSAHDGPSILMDWKLRNKHEELARRGEKISDEEAEEIDDDPTNFGFNLACPENSRIRDFYNGLEYGALPSGPSFVEDHRTTMDLCQNPEWQYMHGFTAWTGPRPRHLQPLFSFSKTSMHSDLLCVPLEQFVNTPTSDPEWEDKKSAKIIWRGSMTGVWFDRVSWWRTSQRTRLHFLSQAKEGSRYVRFVENTYKGNEVIREDEVDLATLNQRYLDAGYVGELHQCTQTDGGCEAIPKQIETVKGMDWESQNDYKYIVDTDGNAWSGRFHRLMASNSLVLKSTIFPEWYTDRVMPWVHYVPLKIDYTDLYDLMAFFSGDVDGIGGHDDLAKQIAYNGRDWTQKHWRVEDMEVYAFRLYLEWARVTAHDQANADYTG